MEQKIKEMFKRFDVEPNEGLISSLALLVDHERLDAKHEVMIQAMDAVDEILGRKEKR